MKVVLYSSDYIPIVVLDVNESIINHIEQNRYFRMALNSPKYHPSTENYMAGFPLNYRAITITGHPLRHSQSNRKDWLLQLPYVEDSDYVTDLFDDHGFSYDRYRYYHHEQLKEREAFIKCISRVSVPY